MGSKTEGAPAVERALDIFELLSSSKAGLTLSDLSSSLGVPKSSVHYLLKTLMRRGYLCRNEVTHRLLLSLKILTLHNAALGSIELRRHAAPHLYRLMENSGLTVHLAVLEGDDVVLVDRLKPPGGARVATWVGKRMDLHCTAVGKAIMAYLPDEQDEEGEIGFRCVGCPIFDGEGRIIAAISVAGTTSQVTSDNAVMLSKRVMETADAISRRIGLPGAGVKSGRVTNECSLPQGTAVQSMQAPAPRSLTNR